MTPFTVNFVAVTEYTDCVNFFKNRLTTEQAVVKLKLSKRPPTGFENYQNLQQMSSFKDFLRCYNNKDVVPSLEAMQKMFAFYHDKDIDMLKLGCTLPNLAIICFQKSTDAKFYPFTEGDKDLLEKIREDNVGGPSIKFTRKAVADKILFENQQTDANLLLGLTLANFTPTRCVNPCRPVFARVGISIQKRVDSYLDKTRPAYSKIWWCLICNEQDQNVKLKAS